MSYPKFFVTYTVLTTEAGSNPFWHASLLMSEQTSPGDPIRVKDAIGFYSEIPSSTTNPIIKALKSLLGFKIDLQDSHGHLRKEKIRDLDKQGLKGTTFDVKKTQYDDLTTLYNKAIKDEDTAIKELNHQISKEGYTANGNMRYLREEKLAAEKKRIAEEMLAARVDLNEQDRLAAENQLAIDPALKPRLKPFHITMDITLRGFNSEKSYTCKTRALDFLLDAKIITEDEYKKFKSSPFKAAFPRCYEIPLPPIQLISTGEPKREGKKNKPFYNRSWGNNELFWTHSPRIHTVTLSVAESKFKNNQYILIKNMVKQIDKVELLLLNKIESCQTAKNEGDVARLTPQLERILKLKNNFRATTYNQTEKSLIADLADAERGLNIARMALTPDKINYTFLNRALENISLRYALLGLLTVTLVATWIVGVAGVALTVGASMFASYHFFKAINREIELSKRYAHYAGFNQPLMAATT